MCLKRFMDFKEWREFSSAITAGVFGGLIVTTWQLTYEIFKDNSLQERIIFSALTIAILYCGMILFLRWLFLKKENTNKNIDIENKSAEDKNWKEILELKKIYFIQLDKFESKLFFSWFTISIMLFLAFIREMTSLWLVVIIVSISLLILGILIHRRRKKSYNQVIFEIKNKSFNKIS